MNCDHCYRSSEDHSKGQSTRRITPNWSAPFAGQLPPSVDCDPMRAGADPPFGSPGPQLLTGWSDHFDGDKSCSRTIAVEVFILTVRARVTRRAILNSCQYRAAVTIP